MTIIWLNIWDIQSRSRAKGLINRCFNIKSYIATICDANMNPSVPQCKNYWKWEHITFLCQIQGSKYAKFNSPHKTEHYCQFAQCCKVNFKTNPPRLKKKQGKPCPHSFKCLNCKGKHQVDSNTYPFQKHCFNREQHSKKY